MKTEVTPKLPAASWSKLKEMRVSGNVEVSRLSCGSNRLRWLPSFLGVFGWGPASMI